MNTLYVGIDVSSKSNVVYLMLPNGDKHSNFSVANSHEVLWSSIFVTLMANKIGGLQFGIYRKIGRAHV